MKTSSIQRAIVCPVGRYGSASPFLDAAVQVAAVMATLFHAVGRGFPNLKALPRMHQMSCDRQTFHLQLQVWVLLLYIHGCEAKFRTEGTLKCVANYGNRPKCTFRFGSRALRWRHSMPFSWCSMRVRKPNCWLRKSRRGEKGRRTCGRTLSRLRCSRWGSEATTKAVVTAPRAPPPAHPPIGHRTRGDEHT